jgi:3'-phosphoadenosine 5'-phosphosulfate sulfotransferase (PAPS reductase)/FAD synthetase
LLAKIRDTLKCAKEVHRKAEGKIPFIAFSTGKDSLAMAALLYEALPQPLPCLYSHHDLEFKGNLGYVNDIRARGFNIEVVHPFLTYFDLMARGMGFLTLREPWCVPMLVGTGFLEWLRIQGVAGPREALMFRGMSGGEYSRKFHSRLELYRALDMPCFNPMLNFTTEEIYSIIRDRYGLPLNPIYQNMNRSYCICCYTSDARRQAYSSEHHPAVCRKYYGQIERMLFDSGLLARSRLPDHLKTRQEKLDRHGFVYWQRSRYQDCAGAIRRRLQGGILSYTVRKKEWIATKHLRPVDGHWTIVGDEIRFNGLKEQVADGLIKRMLNCLDCGFCMAECFACRSFDRKTKRLEINGCIGCGRCLRVKFCMGWRHRFWRRVIVAA